MQDCHIAMGSTVSLHDDDVTGVTIVDARELLYYCSHILSGIRRMNVGVWPHEPFFRPTVPLLPIVISVSLRPSP